MCDCDQKTVAVSLVVLVCVGGVVGVYYLLKKPPRPVVVTEEPARPTAAPAVCNTTDCIELSERYRKNRLATLKLCDAEIGFYHYACGNYPSKYEDITGEINDSISKTLEDQLGLTEAPRLTGPQQTVRAFWTKFTSELSRDRLNPD